MIPTVRTLRRIAIASSLFEPVPLGLAVHRPAISQSLVVIIGFVKTER